MSVTWQSDLLVLPGRITVELTVKVIEGCSYRFNTATVFFLVGRSSGRYITIIDRLSLNNSEYKAACFKYGFLDITGMIIMMGINTRQARDIGRK